MDRSWPARWRIAPSVSRHLLVRNLLTLTGGMVVARLVNFGAITLIAHRLGPVRFGAFFFTLTVFIGFGLIANVGLENLIVREVTRHPRAIRPFIGRVLAVKVLALPIGMGMVAWIAHLNPALGGMACWLYVYGQMYAELLLICAIFRGAEQMGRQAMLVSLQALLIAGGSVLALWFTVDPLWVAAAHGIGATIAVLVGWRWLIWHLGAPIIRWEPAAWRALAWVSAPFTVSMLGLLLFDRQAMLFITWSGDGRALGWFNAMYVVILGLANVPVLVTNAMLPLLARQIHRGNAVASTIRPVVHALTALGVMLGLLLFSVAPVLVPLIYGEAYRPAVPILQILSVSVPGVFCVILFNGILQILDAQRQAALAFAVALLFSLALTGVLTARYGYLGGTVGYAVSALWVATVLAGVARVALRRFRSNLAAPQ